MVDLGYTRGVVMTVNVEAAMIFDLIAGADR
jgi:hypothetical protein